MKKTDLLSVAGIYSQIPVHDFAVKTSNASGLYIQNKVKYI
jgi:hypothetical protein